MIRVYKGFIWNANNFNKQFKQNDLSGGCNGVQSSFNVCSYSLYSYWGLQNVSTPQHTLVRPTEVVSRLVTCVYYLVYRGNSSKAY